MRDPGQQVTEVRRIFSRVAPVYDLLNRVLSLREDVRWRRFVAGSLRLKPGDRLLDVATGTADLAIACAKRPELSLVVGADLVPGMLVQAGKKLGRVKGGIGAAPVALTAADAMGLPFPDQSFGAVTIAFGIRNIPRRVEAMAEMARVLRPGGRIYVLEFTTPLNPLVRRVYRRYLTRLLPLVGGLVSGDGASYRYLAETILEFPPPGEFREEMARAGFAAPRSHPLTKGIAWVHVGEKPREGAAGLEGASRPPA